MDSPPPNVEIARELTSASLKRAEVVRNLPPGSHIHISGVCGTGMASVLQLLKQKGFYVTGSDKAFYPPMGEVVRNTADLVYEGYSEKNLIPQPTLVVIGNSLSRGNPEVEHVISNNLPFASMPEVFSALLIGTREECSTSVVVAGTHGKTTTTSAVATLLDKCGRKPGYFIGGIPKDLPSSIRPPADEQPADERIVVLEGDEYDSAFFSKFSKFQSYRPDIAVITSLEFDHADIFQTIDDIDNEFEKFVCRVPAGGLILVCDTDKRVVDLALRWHASGKMAGELAFYGHSERAKFRLKKRQAISSATGETSSEYAQELIFSIGEAEITCLSPLSGEYNALNLLAAAAVCSHKGIPLEKIAAAVPQFHGALRRQNLVAEVRGIKIVEDFAHHPTAVDVTLRGLRESYPGSRIVAVFEPRSNTSRRAVFQDAYAKSFSAADKVVLLDVQEKGGYSSTATPVVVLSTAQLVDGIINSGVDAVFYPTVPALEDYLVQELRTGDVAILMSNGDFGGLVTSLPVRLKNS